jgi:hypothetical protein
MTNPEYDQRGKNRPAVAKKLDAIGWGLFFVWIGTAVLAGARWGAGLAGVGVIAAGTQAARKYFGLPVERLGLVIGIVFLGWGVWELFGAELGRTGISGSLLPVVCIVVGVALVVSALLRKPRG